MELETIAQYPQKNLSLLNIIHSTEMGPFICENFEEAFDTLDERNVCHFA